MPTIALTNETLSGNKKMADIFADYISKCIHIKILIFCPKFAPLDPTESD